MNKKTFGPKTFLYPMPVVIVGAKIEGKPNFNTIAYCGVVQGKPPMIGISMAKNRFTYQGIIKYRKFSINIPGENLLELIDYVGIVSGKNIDKSGLFKIFYGKLKSVPMIKECPINMECELFDRMDFGGKNDFLVGKVIETYCSDNCITEGFPDIEKIRPVLLAREDMKYWSTGHYLGKALEIGKNYKPSFKDFSD